MSNISSLNTKKEATKNNLGSKPELAPPREPENIEPIQKFDLSTKDTKSRLLEVAEILNLEVGEKTTKKKILDILSTSDRVSIKEATPSRRKINKNK